MVTSGLRSGLLTGPELTARSIDVDAAVAADAGVDPAFAQARRELRDAFRRRCSARVPAGGVERDQVDVRAAAEPAQPAGQRVGLVRMVVDACDARVLERDPAALGVGVLARGVEHLGDRVAAVERDELGAQRVVGRVQARPRA